MGWTYQVREWAPDVLLLGNIGVVQARQTSSKDIESLVRDVGADALCVHLNPAMELIQSDGDRDFRGCVETLERLAASRDLVFMPNGKEHGGKAVFTFGGVPLFFDPDKRLIFAKLDKEGFKPASIKLLLEKAAA